MRRSAPEDLCLVSGQRQTAASSIPPNTPHPHPSTPHPYLPYLPATTSLLDLHTHTHTQQIIHRKWRSNDLFWGNGSKVADSSRLFTRVGSTLILKLNRIKGYLTTASLKHSSLKCRRYLQLKWMLRAPCIIPRNCRAHATPLVQVIHHPGTVQDFRQTAPLSDIFIPRVCLCVWQQNTCLPAACPPVIHTWRESTQMLLITRHFVRKRYKKKYRGCLKTTTLFVLLSDKRHNYHTPYHKSKYISTAVQNLFFFFSWKNYFWLPLMSALSSRSHDEMTSQLQGFVSDAHSICVSDLNMIVS